MLIEVVNLKRYFGKTKAVDDISFSFKSGQTYGFIGPNGAGKTTAMRIMATLDEPTDGDCLIDGLSVIQEPEKARRLVGYMPDSLPTHRDITVHDYLDFFARAYGLRGRKRTQTVERIEQFTNLQGIKLKTLKALSKGMKQRVSLARSMVHDPSLLIMDEPAAGLDPRARVELRELIRALCDQGKAILISSHILTELAEICDGAVIIEHGTLLRSGTIEEITHSVRQNKKLITISIRPLELYQDLHKQLLALPGIEAVREVGPALDVDIEQSDEACCQLLEELIKRGFRIVEFKQHQEHLEDLFMSITTGKVQ